MNLDPGLLSDDERDLLARVAAWTDRRIEAELSQSSLAQLAVDQGVDFATAYLYQRLRESDRHGPFIRRIDELLIQAPQPRAKMDALVALAPGAFYRELPGTGANGWLLRQRVEEHGCRTVVIPTHSQGSAAENGRVIGTWLAEHAQERILLASLSKGGADVKAALARPDADRVFRPVVAWLNLSGITQGSPSVSWLRQSWLVAAFFRWLCWWKGIDYAIGRQLEWGAGTVLDFPLVVPPHLTMISIIGFPLSQHFTSAVLRRFHSRIAALGPNDGMILLADVCALPGLVYPVWGGDHNLRPDWDIRRLVAALAHYLADTLNLWARSAEDAPCP